MELISSKWTAQTAPRSNCEALQTGHSDRPDHGPRRDVIRGLPNPSLIRADHLVCDCLGKHLKGRCHVSLPGSLKIVPPHRLKLIFHRWFHFEQCLVISCQLPCRFHASRSFGSIADNRVRSSGSISLTAHCTQSSTKRKSGLSSYRERLSAMKPVLFIS
jgi:hypothetical protein